MKNTTLINSDKQSVISVTSFKNGCIAVDIITFVEDDDIVRRNFQRLYLTKHSAAILCLALQKEVEGYDKERII